MSFKHSLIKLAIVLAIFFTGISVINIPITESQKVQASVTSKKAKRNGIVKLAKAELGKSYVYGATGPSAFDCSGLVQYVYKNATGINLSRTTYAQVKEGKMVSMSNLQPGDLLFWGSAATPYHVGIYIGKGRYIHAATPTQGVREQNLSGYFYPSVAKRVL